MLKRTTGEKIKRISNIVCIIMVFVSIAAGIITFSFGFEGGIPIMKYLGFAIMIVGLLMFWLLDLIISGFAEVVDNTSKIAKSLKTDDKETIDTLKDIKCEVEKIKMLAECKNNN